jgi:protein CrcB
MAALRVTRRQLAAVVGGGFCGTLARYGVSTVIQAWLGKAWPYDILLINVTGALLLAFCTSLADATILIGPTRRLFITVGLLGAYTTFSSLTLGDVLLLEQRQWVPAVWYLALSLGGGILAVLIGNVLGQWLIKKVRPTLLSNVTRKLTETLHWERKMQTDHMKRQEEFNVAAREDQHQPKR